MLSMTPPGHWFSIAQQVLERDAAFISRTASISSPGSASSRPMPSSAAGTRSTEYNLIRPISYIKKYIDPRWEPVLNTPPFPEYPSGHSTASAAAATVLTAFFGDADEFETRPVRPDGLSPRTLRKLRRGRRRSGHLPALRRHPLPLGDRSTASRRAAASAPARWR